MNQNLSAVIITFNEEKNIERCLTSLQGVVDEIIVVDSFSTDQTEAICKKFEVKFILHKFDGHIQQKNWAKDQANNDFILSLDADEALSDDLKESIKQVKQRGFDRDGYSMNRLTNYCGKWIRHTAWYPDVKLRLFNRTRGTWGGTNPHDEFLLIKEGSKEHLKGDLLHYSFYTTEEHLIQIAKFSTIGAKALHAKGTRSNWLKIVVKPIARFLKNYIVRSGFLDGKEGFAISKYSAYANYLKYQKLLKLQKGVEID